MKKPIAIDDDIFYCFRTPKHPFASYKINTVYFEGNTYYFRPYKNVLWEFTGFENSASYSAKVYQPDSLISICNRNLHDGEIQTFKKLIGESENKSSIEQTQPISWADPFERYAMGTVYFEANKHYLRLYPFILWVITDLDKEVSCSAKRHYYDPDVSPEIDVHNLAEYEIKEFKKRIETTKVLPKENANALEISQPSPFLPSQGLRTPRSSAATSASSATPTTSSAPDAAAVHSGTSTKSIPSMG